MVQPTVTALKQEGMPFVGVLFAGLMVDGGRAQLLEYNVRFGDPECQTLMVRLRSDLVQVLLKACKGLLKGAKLEWSDDPAVVVVVAARGYPGNFAKGEPIRRGGGFAATHWAKRSLPVLATGPVTEGKAGRPRPHTASRARKGAWRTPRRRGRSFSTRGRRRTPQGTWCRTGAACWASRRLGRPPRR